MQCTVLDEHLQVRFIANSFEEHNYTILTDVNMNHSDELVLALYWRFILLQRISTSCLSLESGKTLLYIYSFTLKNSHSIDVREAKQS